MNYLWGGTNQEKWKEVKRLIEDLVVLNFNNETAILASKLYHQLRKQNKMIEFRDIFIAATAIHHDIPLLTLNTKDFSRIKNLKFFESNS
jgi:predicted nucleic acid-binding protein